MKNWQAASVRQGMICVGETDDIETYPSGSSLHKLVESENKMITPSDNITNLAWQIQEQLLCLEELRTKI